MAKTKTLPPRNEVKIEDCWDLSSLFQSDAEWEKALRAWEKQIPQYAGFRGKLGQSARTLTELLRFDSEFERSGERLGVYAFLRTSEDNADSKALRMKGRYQHIATRAAEAASWIQPEILALPQARIDTYLKSKELSEWKLLLDRIVRYRPHTLSEKEETLLAMQGTMASAARQIFRQLNDADLKWPALENERGERVELGHSSLSAFLHSPKRSVRKEAFHTFYSQFEAHRNTLAATLNGSVQTDVYFARARNYKSALEASLFHDNVPVRVYDNLIRSVHRHLPTLHRYYELRRTRLKLKDIHHYDTYVPIVSGIEKHHTWDEAVKLVTDALEPMGDEYCRELHRGLTTARWCDRYANQGKQSGAFSSGSYDAEPFILMNYQPTVLDHVFTLAHEAGHSMHSFYSSRHQPFQYYDYTIFVAEVASTFNEQLLLRHLTKQAKTKKERAYLLNHAVDEIRQTLIRQTMFAEFERITHALVEAGEPLTVERLRAEYRQLLDLYFGPGFVIDKELELECLRIPHFYNAFYVYKYATGLSAAIALSQRVLNGGQRELDDYIGFLKGGSSKYPLDLLRDAGVDMEKPKPVDTALRQFHLLIEELEELL